MKAMTLPYREVRALPHGERVNDEIRALGGDIDVRAVVRPVALREAQRLKPVRRRFVLIELCRALLDSGRWWLIPMVAVLGLSAVLLAVVAAIEYVAPFVYTIF